MTYFVAVLLFFSVNVSELERKIYQGINAERTGHHVNALTPDDGLSNIARAHSADMAKRGYFSHVNPEGQNHRSRVYAAGYKCARVGENLSERTVGTQNADAITSNTVKGWMASSGHRQN